MTIYWSGLTPCGEFHVLRTTVPVKDQVMTIYEKNLRKYEYMKQSLNKNFIPSPALKALIYK
ncbi:hypothetical protein PSOS111911_19495 [Pseudoalteromonas ostreae]